MLACDVCFAAESAQFGDQHAPFGLIPGWGGSQRLTRLMGQRRALDLMFSARWLAAEEAKEAGLVNYIVPDADLHKSALEYCEKIATRSRPGIAEMKRLAREGADLGIDHQMRLERDAAVRTLPGDDVAEGLDAFENRRAPNVKVSDGQSVSEGDVIAVMESMKLEISIRAPAAGIASNISVSTGDMIDRGQVIAEILPSEA